MISTEENNSAFPHILLEDAGNCMWKV